jgi:hypothetical protein
MQIALRKMGLVLDPYAFYPEALKRTAWCRFGHYCKRVLFGMKSKGKLLGGAEAQYCFGSELQGVAPGGSSGDLRASFRFSEFFRIIITSGGGQACSRIIAKRQQQTSSWIGRKFGGNSKIITSTSNQL